MTRKTMQYWTMTALALTVLAAPLTASAGVAVGDPAPDFTLTDTAGNQVSLSDFKGKIVVLEWLNPDCPFVQRHYKAGTMKKLAAEHADVVWLTINSTHYMDAAANAKFERRFRAVEAALAARGLRMTDLGIDMLEEEWQAVKDAQAS